MTRLHHSELEGLEDNFLIEELQAPFHLQHLSQQKGLHHEWNHTHQSGLPYMFFAVLVPATGYSKTIYLSSWWTRSHQCTKSIPISSFHYVEVRFQGRDEE